VATGHRDSTVRVRAADTSEQIVQWRAPILVNEVFVDGAARQVIARVTTGLIVWSFASSSSGQQGETTAQPRNSDGRPSHAWSVTFVSLSSDGLISASSDRSEVIIWDGTTVTSILESTATGAKLGRQAPSPFPTAQIGCWLSELNNPRERRHISQSLTRRVKRGQMEHSPAGVTLTVTGPRHLPQMDAHALRRSWIFD
jgi:hypothetical protein